MYGSKDSYCAVNTYVLTPQVAEFEIQTSTHEKWDFKAKIGESAESRSGRGKNSFSNVAD